MIAFDAELDATGLKCPMPVLRAKRALRPLSNGQVLRLLADDPASKNGCAIFCLNIGAELFETSFSEGAYEFLIRKGSI